MARLAVALRRAPVTGGGTRLTAPFKRRPPRNRPAEGASPQGTMRDNPLGPPPKDGAPGGVQIVEGEMTLVIHLRPKPDLALPGGSNLLGARVAADVCTPRGGANSDLMQIRVTAQKLRRPLKRKANDVGQKP